MLKRSLIVLFVVLGVAVGCSSGNPTSSPPTTVLPSGGSPSTSPEQRAAAVTNEVGQGTIAPNVSLAPPVTFASDPSADQVFTGLGEQLPMADDERACAAGKLSSDGALLDRVKRLGATVGSEDFGRLAGFMDQCRRSVTFARSTASAISNAHGGLPPDQIRCLQDGYGRMSAADIDAAVAAGTNPSGSLAPRGVQVVSGLLTTCGVK